MDGSRKKVPATFYRTTRGAEPVRDWLKEFAAADRKALGVAIARVEFGWPVGMPVSRPVTSRAGTLGDTLQRQRWSHSTDSFCIHAQQLVLLHGFVKKTQKTAEREIEIAVRRMREVNL